MTQKEMQHGKLNYTSGMSRAVFTIFEDMVRQIKTDLEKVPNQFIDTSNLDGKRDAMWGITIEPEVTEYQITAIRIDNGCVEVRMNDEWYGLSSAEEIYYAQTVLNVYECYFEYIKVLR